MRNPIAIASLALLVAASTLACSKSEKREWNASDHDQPQETPAPQPAPTRAAPEPAAAADPWTSTCAPCHGPTGKGDGPMGAAMRAPDLTNKDWQAKISDEQIAQTIKAGRGRMPGFSSLPAASVDALVKHVRSFK